MASLPCSQAPLGPKVKPCTRCLQRTLGGVGEGWENGGEHGANVSQPEPQNCDPPRRELLEEKEKKNVEWLLRDFVFRVHISHSSSPGGSISSTQISVLFNVKEGSTDVHCCSVTSVKYVYVNLYFYNMQMHLNLYRRTPLALVNTGCNILHENCAKMGLMSSFRVRIFLFSHQSAFSQNGKATLFLLVHGWIQCCFLELSSDPQAHPAL